MHTKLKSIVVFLLIIINVFLLMACNGKNSTNNLPNKGSVVNDLDVFIKQDKGYIGDPIPYFDGNKMNVFYLYDSRNTGSGAFHPWNLFQTDNLIKYEDKGNAIDVVNDVTSPDFALGTGSVIKDKNGLYHAFYTGHNDRCSDLLYYEKIQHATSTDLLNWTKIPEDGFYGKQNDFRDPCVLYMANEDMYWMLITTRVNNRGVIEIYKSSDLKNWKDSGIFFNNDSGSYNMECPTLIQYSGYWYLTYSQQAPDGSTDRVMRYRYKKNLSDAVWIKPDIDYIDGAGFYAGKLEKYFDRMLAFGWVGTKTADYDAGTFNWAGNLVVHELKQDTNGQLYAIAVKEVTDKLATEVNYDVISKSDNINFEKDKFSFAGKSRYDYLLFDNLEKKPTLMTFKISGATSGKLGISYAKTTDENFGDASIVLDLDNNKLEFYNENPLNITSPQISVNLSKSDVYNCKIISSNECLTIYINDKIALTTRIYSMPNKEFGFFSKGAAADISNIRFFE